MNNRFLPTNTILLFEDDEYLYRKRDNNISIILIKLGNKFKKKSENVYEVGKEEKSFLDLFSALKSDNKIPNQIVYKYDSTNFNSNNRTALYSLLFLARSLIKLRVRKKIKLLYIYKNNEGLASVFNDAINGFMRTLEIEHPDLNFNSLKIDSLHKISWDVIKSAFAANQSEIVVENNEWYGKTMVKNPENNLYLSPFKERGCYLITGGMGKLGTLLAEYLITNYQANIILIGRQPVNEEYRKKIKQLKSLGGDVTYLNVNLLDYNEVGNLKEKIENDFKSLQGIIWCAGILKDSLIMNKSVIHIEEVLKPKIDAVILFDKVMQDVAVDFWLLFSSVSHLGNLGQADYAVANSFLNSFASYRSEMVKNNKRHGKTVSINWPFWEHGAMHLPEQRLKKQKEKGFFPLPVKNGMQAIELALSQEYDTELVLYGDSRKIEKFVSGFNIKNEEKENVRDMKNTSYEKQAILDEIRKYLKRKAEEIVKVGNIDIDLDLSSYGFDSISNVDFANQVNDHYDLDIMPTIFFELEEPTINAFSTYLLTNYYEKMKAFYNTLLKRSENKEDVVEQIYYTEDKISDKATYNEKLEFHKKGNDNFLFEEHKENSDNLVAVVGMNGIFPQSDNLHEFWEKLEDGHSLISEIPNERFNWRTFNDSHMKWGAFLKDVRCFDADYFNMSRQEAVVLDPQHRMFMQVVWNTIEDAGYKPSSLSGTDTGIFVGIGTQDYTQIVEDNLTEYNPYTLTGRSPFMLPNRISSLLNMHGPSEAIDTACSSSLVAIHKAVESVKSGTCTMAIAGGVNLILSPVVYKAFSEAGMLSETGECKVFDENANGTVRGEGVGAILLKRLSNAMKDGDYIYGIIRNSGENHKGKSASLTAPNALAEKELIKRVYQEADIRPDTVNYIEVHSTGTKMGDPVEILGLKGAYDELANEAGIRLEENTCAISSVKPVIGHLEAASGIASVIKVLLSMQHKKILALPNFEKLNPYISLKNSPFYINKTNATWNRVRDDIPRRAGISAFGFGGVNAHVIIEEYTENFKHSYYVKGNRRCICFSGKTIDVIREQAKQLFDWMNREENRENNLDSISYTLQVGREEFGVRLAFCVTSIDELKEKLESIINGDEVKGSGIFYGKVDREKALSSVLNKSDIIEHLNTSLILNEQLDILLQLWVNGVDINWELLYDNGFPPKISLPPYPFQKKEYWINMNPENIADTKKYEEECQDVEKNFSSIQDYIVNMLNEDFEIIIDKNNMNTDIRELGIDSIVLMQVLRKLKIMNCDIDFESLYRCKTMNNVIEIIDNNIRSSIKQDINNTSSRNNNITKTMELVYKTSTPETVVLKKYPELIKMNNVNIGKPVFWLHGGFGGVEIYRLIANCINRPFYGIQAKGYMTSREPLNDIESMAAYYIEIIESVQPSGPYDLGGLSMGGILAYEVCRQLQQRGHTVNSVIMLETIYVDEKMRDEWNTMSIKNIKKDQIFRAGNLLLAFSSEKDLELVTESEINLNVSDEEFLEQFSNILRQRGMNKSINQIKKMLTDLQKILNSLDVSTTMYKAKQLDHCEQVKCIYFCNPVGTLFGDDEEYFRLVEKGRIYNFRYFAEMWKKEMPKLEIVELNNSSHMTILTEEESKNKILDMCIELYNN